MALSIPKVGFSRMLKEGVKHYRGVEESVLRNVEACVELAATIRSAYGPDGMNKIVINNLEKLFVTNDAATIMKELEVAHPAAKMLVMAAQMQEQEVGDGTNMTITFSASLLENAGELLRMGLSCTEVAEGYSMAAKKALEILPELVVKKVDDLRDKKAVAAAIRPVVMSKHRGYEDFLAGLIAEACIAVTPVSEKSFNVDNVRVAKIIGAGLLSSRVMRGMVFRRGAEGDVTKVDGAKIAVFTGAFDIVQTETKGTVLLSKASELLSYSQDEESLVEQQVKALAEAGINVVVSGGKFGDLHTHFLNKYRIMGVKVASKFDLRRLCKSVGATVLTKISVPSVEEIGRCGRVAVEEIGDTEVVVFQQDDTQGQIATIVIRGSSENLMDDIERAVDDGINAFKALTKDNRMVPGAGAVEVELARRVESFGELCPGLEQYSVQKFAHSLESLPKQLADNAGVKATEILAKLYAEHQKGNATAGFDNEVEGGGVKDVVAAGILDPYLVKYWAIKLATDAAVTVLKVDQIIMAKQVSGPKPKQRGGDEDD